MQNGLKFSIVPRYLSFSAFGYCGILHRPTRVLIQDTTTKHNLEKLISNRLLLRIYFGAAMVGKLLKAKGIKRLIILGIIILNFDIALAQGKPVIAILANSIDYELASEFFGFLEDRGIEKTHVTADNFDDYKQNKFIIILGGPDAYEGVGGIVQQVLTDAEQGDIRKSGSKKMYVKTNIWRTGQVVIVIAGSNREMTKAAHQENQRSIVDQDRDGDGTKDVFDENPLESTSLQPKDVLDEKTLKFLEQLEILDAELDNISQSARHDLFSFWNGTLDDQTTQIRFNKYGRLTQDVYSNITNLYPPKELASALSNYSEFIRQRVQVYDKIRNKVVPEPEYQPFSSESKHAIAIWIVGDRALSNAQKTIKEFYESMNLAPSKQLTDNIYPEPIPKTPDYPKSTVGLNVERIETNFYLYGIVTEVKVTNVGDKTLDVEVKCFSYGYGGDLFEIGTYANLGAISPNNWKGATLINEYNRLAKDVYCWAIGK